MLRVWIFLLAADCCMGVLTWRHQPTNKLAFEGAMVQLRCTTSSGLGQNDHHHWVRLNPTSGQQTFLTDGTTLSPTLSEDVRSRYLVRANHNQGVYDLQIKLAKWYDSGQYGCIVYNRVASRRSISRFANVDIVRKLIPQGSPECTLIPAHPGPGDLVAFTCSSLVPNALSSLVWTRENEVMSSTAVLNERTRRIVTFHRRLRDMDNHAVYTCTEKYPLENSPTASCSLVPFDIPMNVSLQPAAVRTVVGTPIIFSCLAASVPPVNRYWWLFDGHPVIEKPDVFQLLDGGRRLKIKGVLAASDTQYEVRCKAMNTLNLQRSAIGFITVLSSASNESLTLTPIQTDGYTNETFLPGIQNKPFSGTKTKVHSSDSRNFPKVRETPRSTLLATITGIGACMILGLVVVIALWFRRRAAKDDDDDDDEIPDDIPRILEISSPRPGPAEEPIPPARDSSRDWLPNVPTRESSLSGYTNSFPQPPGMYNPSPSRGNGDRSRKYNRPIRHSYQPLQRERSKSIERVRYMKHSKSVSLYENTMPLRLSYPENSARTPILKASRKEQFAPLSI